LALDITYKLLFIYNILWFLQVLLTHIKQEPSSPEPELVEVEVDPAAAFPYLMDPNEAFQPPLPSTPPRGMPQIVRQKPAGRRPIPTFFFDPGPLDVRIPAYNANHNPSMTHKDHSLAFSLPSQAIGLIVVTLDAKNGQVNLAAAHYAYPNQEIFGKSSSKYLGHQHLFGHYVVDLF
jgi:hypothetical protein